MAVPLGSQFGFGDACDDHSAASGVSIASATGWTAPALAITVSSTALVLRIGGAQVCVAGLPAPLHRRAVVGPRAREPQHR
eukprot:14139949-Alexandrium_andersonii.AAC.2